MEMFHNIQLKSEDDDSLIKGLFEHAKWELKKGKFFNRTFMKLQHDGEICTLGVLSHEYANEKDKYDFAVFLLETIYEANSDLIITISDAWVGDTKSLLAGSTQANRMEGLVLQASTRERLLIIHQTYRRVRKKIRFNNDKKSSWLDHQSFIHLPKEKRSSFYGAVTTNPWEFIDLIPMEEMNN